jgi:hypothetical protein
VAGNGVLRERLPRIAAIHANAPFGLRLVHSAAS